MDNKKNLIIALLVIALVILAYMVWADKGDSPQDSANVGQDQDNNIIAEPPPPPPAPAPIPNPEPGDISAPTADKFADNNWLLQGLLVDGKVVDMSVSVPRAMTLNFDKAKKTYSGFAGCNSFTGAYAVSGADRFDFGAAASTKMYCMESSPLENQLFNAMGKIDRYMITPEGNLVLRTADSQTKIEYKPAI